MYKKVLITGGAGYIGSHLAHEIKTNFGDKILVVIADNLVNSYKPKIKGVVFENTDITDMRSLSKIFSKYNFDFVYHLAALADARESQSIPFEYYKTNVEGTINVLDCIKKNKIKDFFFASSCSVYGNAGGEITEDVDLKPISVYGQTKLISEKIIEKFSYEFNINSTIFRLFNVAGAQSDGRLGELSKKKTRIITKACFAVLNNDTFKIYGKNYKTKDGTCGRDYVHVDDVVSACMMLLNNSKNHTNFSEIFNVGSSELVTNLEIVKQVEKISNKKVNLEFGEGSEADPESVVSKVDKIYKYYGWKPKKSSLENIVESSWNWFLNIR